jgi:DNA-binding beta-propeller fold protein YncE
MPISKRAIAVLACLPPLAAYGQQRQVSGPVAGYVFDGAALRPITGVMGGATLGDALGLGLAASAAVVSPQLDSAIATAKDGSLHLFQLSGLSATEVAWNSVPSRAQRVVYSPSGTAAAIYAAGRVQVVSGLPNAPVAAFTVELGSAPGKPARQPASAAPEAMALSDDAAWLLVAGDGRLRLLGASGSSSVLLEPEARTVAVAFAPSGHAAAVLSGAGPWLDVYPDVAAAPADRIAAPGLAEPAGLAFSADGKLVLAAARDGRSVTIFDLADGPTTLACACAPTGVARMGKLFRLTDAGAGPVWLVDTGVNPARIVFVPARANP